MNWNPSSSAQKAVSDDGYVITWAKNKHGVWYNAYTPEHQHIEAGYNDAGKAKCKAACAAHLQKAVAA